MSKRSQQRPQSPPWKMLLWTAIAGLIFGLIGFGEIAEDWLRVARNSFHKHKASGDIVLLMIDDKSLREIGNWPWPRRTDAELVDRLSAAGAKRIYFDVNFSFPSEPAQDRAFAKSLERSGRVTLLARTKAGPDGSTNLIDALPLKQFSKHAKLGVASVHYNYQNAVWELPYAAPLGGRSVQSFAASLAGTSGPPGSRFPLDYSTDLLTIPTYPAGDVLTGRVSAKQLAGKDVVIGIGTDVIGDSYFIPGYGKAFGVHVHAIGAETLKNGRPVGVGWVPGLLFGLASAYVALRFRRRRQRYPAIAGAIAALIGVPASLEARLIFVDVTPGIFVLLVVVGVLTTQRFRARGLVNPVSNLPNLNALRVNREGRSQALIAARILNYEEILSTLPPNTESQLIEQVVARLSVGASDRVLYQGDGGIFAWFEKSRAPFGNHLDALYSLFRNPARIAGMPIDLAISFGVEIGSSRSLPNRLASALVAADDAAHDGLKWKFHDPDTLQDASWKLSMLSQLDEAIDKGQVWVAYQPKLELRTRRIIGAEALARWTHPEKGPIAASEFVAAAEQSDRIAKLTDFVLEKAVAAASAINKRGENFDVAVNLSARLLTDKGFILRVSALLARHGLAPAHLTLELTETAALSGSGEGLDMIASLRELGVRISIDDYGTGLSTLDYLKKVPANEIKIDQSFVKGMVENRSDRLMVQSTIGLAHSLGRKVVAEGVEQHATLDLLVEMECDIAQGYVVGRPMSLDSLAKRIGSERKRGVA
ncbi:EAL domain-containing protein (putative c-di-GMP-specific phosphodiesterase class I)/CHASE2 domain-containing sensor protein [Sphingomonas sp. F9_3S_D5_B_2]